VRWTLRFLRPTRNGRAGACGVGGVSSTIKLIPGTARNFQFVRPGRWKTCTHLEALGCNARMDCIQDVVDEKHSRQEEEFLAPRSAQAQRSAPSPPPRPRSRFQLRHSVAGHQSLGPLAYVSSISPCLVAPGHLDRIEWSAACPQLDANERNNYQRQLLMHSPTNSQRLARCDNDPTTPPSVGACWGPTCPNKQPDMSRIRWGLSHDSLATEAYRAAAGAA